MHEDVATGEIEPHHTHVAHLAEEAVNLRYAQFAWEELLAVVGIGVAMAAV